MNIFSKIVQHPQFKSQTVVQATIILTLINLVTRAINYVKEMFIAKYFGATGLMDAYIIGLQIPTLILGLFAGGLAILTIPLYLDKKNNISLYESKRFFVQILVVFGSIFLIIALLTYVFAPQLVRIVAYGFEGDRLTVAIRTTRMLSFYGFLSILVQLFKSIIEAQKQFLIQALTTLVLNTFNVIIIAIYGQTQGINLLILCLYVLIFGEFIVDTILIRCKYEIFKVKNVHINWIEIREIFILLVPILLSSGIGKVNIIVDKSIASTLSFGSIAALEYSKKIWMFPIMLFSETLAITMYPKFSEMASNKLRNIEYKETLNKTINIIIYCLVPSAAFLFVFSNPFIKMMYQRGVFDANATSLTSFVNQMYCLGITFTALNPILFRIFFSFKNTTGPLCVTIIIVATNVLGSLILAKYMNAGGIALATSIAQFVGFVFAYILLSKYLEKMKVKTIKMNKLIKEFIKTILSAIPSIIEGLVARGWILNNSSVLVMLIKTLAVCILMSISYYITSLLIKTQGSMYIQSYILIFKRKIIEFWYKKRSKS